MLDAISKELNRVEEEWTLMSSRYISLEEEFNQLHTECCNIRDEMSYKAGAHLLYSSAPRESDSRCLQIEFPDFKPDFWYP